MKRLRKLISIVVSMTLLTPSFAGDVKLVKTEHGATLKVIARNHTATFKDPNRESASQPVRQFEFFLVAEPGKQKRDGGEFYPVTESDDASEIRWIPAEDAAEWSHRQAFLLTPKTDRGTVQFMESLDDVKLYWNKTGKAKLIGEEPGGADVLSFFPVVEEFSIDRGKEVGTAFRTFFLVGAPSGEPGAAPATVTMQRLSKEMTLDIAFCLDGTGSMDRFIDATKDVVKDIEKRIRTQVQLTNRIRFSLVIYRDLEDGEPVQIVCNFAAGMKPEAFRNALDSIVVGGGGDAPEQMLEGAYTACTELDWNPIANRHVIVIGDEPSHEGAKGLRSMEAVLKAAQPTVSTTDLSGLIKRITIHSLYVGDPKNGNSDLCREQFQKLAQGLHNPGLYAGTKEEADFTNRVTELIANRMRDVEEIFRGDFEATTKRIDAKSDPNMGALGAVIKGIANGKVAPGGFGEGFVAAIDPDGNATIVPHVLISNRELSRFNATLKFFVTILKAEADPGVREVNRIVEGLQRALVTMELNEELPAIGPETSLSKVLSLALGLPIRNPLFDVSPELLKAMPQADFKRLVDSLQESQQSIEDHLTTGHFFSLGNETRPQYRFSFVRMADLP
ncbi:MAG: hypothetical protein KDB01_05620 [Planctomycetaceae bacterium]|nr:hypothetical protein [Planctomycetaceae bacterium]